MFDTSVVRTRAIAAPRATTFAFSIAIHSIAVIAVFAMAVSATRLPQDPPRQMELFRPVELPPTPPPPLGVRRPAATLPHATKGGAEVTHSMTAPAAIPDEIPQVQPQSGVATSLAPAAGGEPVGEPDGVPGGTGTAAGGSGTGSPHVVGEAGLIGPRVLTKVQPEFPANFRNAVTSTTVVVQCVIGKDGRIHEPEIVKSSFTPFNEAVLRALQQWTFVPGQMNGEAVDTYFVLTVKFEIRR